jgi:hypothetical protein
MKVRPQQRLFDSEELRATTGIITTRSTHDAGFIYIVVADIP